MAFNSLSSHLQHASISGQIVCVPFKEVGVQTLHNMYAEDTYLVMWTLICYIHRLQRMLQAFCIASDLVCAWDKTVAAAIPATKM